MQTKQFKRGDRVRFVCGDGKRSKPGTVVQDSDPYTDYTYVLYDDMNGCRSATLTERLELVTELVAECQSRSFCVEIPDVDKFLKISEGTSLDEELMQAGAFSIEANGHYGSAYFFSLHEEDVPNLHRFIQIIQRHLELLDAD